jgi:single-strand DNA-binding protein
MANSINKVTLIGNLGRDPEVRMTQDGQKIVNLSVATDETWTARLSGEHKERVEWHRIVIFNEHLGDVAEKFLRNGPESLYRRLAANTQVVRS